MENAVNVVQSKTAIVVVIKQKKEQKKNIKI